MSLKENVDYIKKEISTEESFLESVFKAENFYKRYKKVILGAAAVAVVALIGTGVSGYINEQNTIAANEAFNKVLEDPKDTKALEELKSLNPKLYQLAVYSNDKSQKIEIDFFKELSLYSEAVESQNSEKIGSLSQNQNFLLKDFALFNKALIEAKQGKYKEAKETLGLIPSTSDVTGLAKMLEHYLLTK
jgi:tetratricopeptide (TPR) repeat protein